MKFALLLTLTAIISSCIKFVGTSKNEFVPPPDFWSQMDTLIFDSELYHYNIARENYVKECIHSLEGKPSIGIMREIVSQPSLIKFFDIDQEGERVYTFPVCIDRAGFVQMMKVDCLQNYDGNRRDLMREVFEGYRFASDKDAECLQCGDTRIVISIDN